MHQTALLSLKKQFEGLSYKRTLKRGYAVIRNSDSRLISDKKAASEEDSLEIEFHDGKITTNSSD